MGGAVEIPTIDGKVKVKIDSGTQPGKVLRLRGKGLPNVNGYGTGDLLVNVSVYVPETLNKDEKRALEEMEESDNFKPNTSIKRENIQKSSRACLTNNMVHKEASRYTIKYIGRLSYGFIGENVKAPTSAS